MLPVTSVMTAMLLAAAAPASGEPPMAFPAEAWREAAPESQGVDSATLAAALDYLQEHSGADGVHEVVIIRRGRMIWHGDRIDQVHGIWSCTKSFTSTVLGLLVDDGKCALDTRVANYVPDLATAYPTLTLRHLTTMTSGYRAMGDEPRGTYRHGPSSTPLEPSDHPLFVPPGTRFAYWDSAMNLLALALTRIAGEPIEELFKRRVADPIGMDPRQWDWGELASVDGLIVNGGAGNANKHVRISARQMARFGHLLLNRGNWNGRQLLSRPWVEAAVAVQVPAATPWAHPESEIDGRGVYGFNWWVNGIQPSGRRKWPAAPPATFAASGHNNNRMFVIPEWDMVIVRLGLDANDGKIGDDVWDGFLHRIGQAQQPSH